MKASPDWGCQHNANRDQKLFSEPERLQATLGYYTALLDDIYAELSAFLQNEELTSHE